MNRPTLAKLARTTKQHIGRLEDGTTEFTRKWAERFAPHLGYTPEEMLFWDKRPSDGEHIESDEIAVGIEAVDEPPAAGTIPELDVRAGLGGGGLPSREVRQSGRYADPIKPEAWRFPSSFIRDELGVPAQELLVLEGGGDSMYPTISSGERVLVHTGHRVPSPDGIYAIRDTFGSIVIKRLQVIRGNPPRVLVISDNPNHKTEELRLDDIEIVGKIVVGLKRL